MTMGFLLMKSFCLQRISRILACVFSRNANWIHYRLEIRVRLVVLRRKDTIFAFDIKDLVPKIYEAEVLPYGELVDFINKVII